MSDKPFLDTNVLIYAFASGDPRAERAAALVQAGGVVSIQVLNEFVNVSRRKLNRDWDAITEMLKILSVLLERPIPLAFEIHQRALDLARRYGFQFYDALIVSAALNAGCTLLYSEDFQDRQRVSGLSIQNPFSGR